jgi:hypothetical protein
MTHRLPPRICDGSQVNARKRLRIFGNMDVLDLILDVLVLTGSSETWVSWFLTHRLPPHVGGGSQISARKRLGTF